MFHLHAVVWTEGETKLLLEYYAQYSSHVGPMKRFKSKRVMFEKISKDLECVLRIKRTGVQCETRFKTVLKRKRDEEKQNKTSGQTRCQVSYEQEFAAISAQDDSLEPEVLRGVRKVIYKKKPSASSSLQGSSGGLCESASSSSSSMTSPEDCSTEQQESAPESIPKKSSRDNRPSTGRMKHMNLFFEEMKKLSEERETRKEERERRKEIQREKRHMEIMSAHAEHMAALKKLAEM